VIVNVDFILTLFLMLIKLAILVLDVSLSIYSVCLLLFVRSLSRHVAQKKLTRPILYTYYCCQHRRRLIIFAAGAA